MIARRLGKDRMGQDLMGGAAVFAAAVVLAVDLPLYTSQFHPGRIDHHNAQMALCLLALAGACLSRREIKGAVLAGAATGLGVAIGLEALIFEAAIGAAFAIGFVIDPQEKRAAAAYGLALAATMLTAFAIQTPPWRWSVAACDALAFNLVAGLALAGLGLATAAQLGATRSLWVRLALLATLGVATAGVYLGLDPDCRHGFFADIDPRIRPIWLNYVNEVRPIPWFWSHDQPLAVTVATPWVVGAIAWIGLGLKRVRRTQAYWLTGVLLAMGVAAGATAVRMSGYAEWFAAPLTAAAVLIPARRYAAGGVVTVLLAAAVGTPSIAASLAAQADKLVAPAKPAKAAPKPVNAMAAAKTGAGKSASPTQPAAPPPRDHCFETGAYSVLAKATPPGLVLSEVDLGPFVVAHTADSALAAPYHRMGWGIMKAHAILAAPAERGAEVMARQAGIAYVLECRFHSRHGDRTGMSKDSLQKRLDAGTPPPWLQPLSAPQAPLQAYRVAPQIATAHPLPGLPETAKTPPHGRTS
jgi:MFS family permease